MCRITNQNRNEPKVYVVAYTLLLYNFVNNVLHLFHRISNALFLNCNWCVAAMSDDYEQRWHSLELVDTLRLVPLTCSRERFCSHSH